MTTMVIERRRRTPPCPVCLHIEETKPLEDIDPDSCHAARTAWSEIHDERSAGWKEEAFYQACAAHHARETVVELQARLERLRENDPAPWRYRLQEAETTINALKAQLASIKARRESAATRARRQLRKEVLGHLDQALRAYEHEAEKGDEPADADGDEPAREDLSV